METMDGLVESCRGPSWGAPEDSPERGWLEIKMVRSRSRSPRRERRRSGSRDRDRRRSRSVSRERERRRRAEGRRRSRSRSRSPVRRRRSRSRSPRRRSRSGSPHRRRSSGSPSRSRSKRGSSPPVRREIDPSKLEGKTEDEIEMMKMMGFCDFDSTKGKKKNDVQTKAGAANILQKRRYRQYMNRRGGFNRPLDSIA
ncbi:uncharacterized protein LOC144909565 [Branchiostoma floridae x Branchiostoma belcheri]